MLVAVMVPTLALSALGGYGAVQRYADAEAVSGVTTQAGRVARTLRLYAGLVAEKSDSESFAVAAEQGLSPAVVSQLLGTDLEAELRSARTRVDAALAEGASATLTKNAPQLAALRARIDAGRASEVSVRAFFGDSIEVAEAAWLAQVKMLTQMAFKTPGSGGIRQSVVGLRDAVDSYLSGVKLVTAAGALTVPGVPDSSTAPTDLAVANALYAGATARLAADLTGHTRAAWQELVVGNADVKTFQRFVDPLVARPGAAVVQLSIPELARIFRTGLVFDEQLRRLVHASATEVIDRTHALRDHAQSDLGRYLTALALIGALSAALALGTARKIIRPLHRLAIRAGEVSAGVIDSAPLDADGPYEIGLVTDAFNEIVANLRALDETALALAAADLDRPVLATTVPGRIGDSLRSSMDLLHQSIRENEELRASLARNEARFRKMADESPDIVWRFSREPTPHFDYLSPSFETHTGMPAPVGEAELDEFVAALDSAGQALVADAIAGRPVPSRFDVTYTRRDGTTAVFELRIAKTPGGLQGAGRDVTEIRALQARLEHQAFHDTLTGLANRALFLDRLAQAQRRAERGLAPIAVLFLDLDDFKIVNDSLGHSRGDELLIAVARDLAQVARPGDTVARIGGDEFALLLESGATPQSAEAVAGRIADVFETPFRLGETNVSVRASIGIAIDPQRGDEAADLMRNADLAMYQAKSKGKGRFEFFHSEMQDEPRTRLAVASDLRHAIEEGELEVFYQPFVGASDAAPMGAEALVRWHHPSRGLLSPAEFIDVAESTGLIVPLGNWVLEEACRQAEAWRQDGVVDDVFSISVNLSARQLSEPRLVERVARVLSDSGLPSSALVLEITESSIKVNFDSGLASLRSLKDLGLRLALDDYGTGYSSLDRMGNLPVDIVKIDKSFVDQLSDMSGTALVRSVIDATRALGRISVAEGVERQDQRSALEGLGCDQLQGYLFARPMPGAETTRTLERLRAHAMASTQPA